MLSKYYYIENLISQNNNNRRILQDYLKENQYFQNRHKLDN